MGRGSPHASLLFFSSSVPRHNADPSAPMQSPLRFELGVYGKAASRLKPTVRVTLPTEAVLKYDWSRDDTASKPFTPIPESPGAKVRSAHALA